MTTYQVIAMCLALAGEEGAQEESIQATAILSRTRKERSLAPKLLSSWEARQTWKLQLTKINI